MCQVAASSFLKLKAVCISALSSVHSFYLKGLQDLARAFTIDRHCHYIAIIDVEKPSDTFSSKAVLHTATFAE